MLNTAHRTLRANSTAAEIKPPKTQRANLIVFSALSLGWLFFSFVFLVLLIPVTSVEGILIRGVISIVPILMLWIFISAGSGKPIAVTTLLLVIVMISELSLRNRSLSDTSLDPQNLVKTAIWGTGLLVALLNFKTLREALREPAVLFLTLLAGWFIVTAVYSPIRVYSLGAGIAFLSLVLFGAIARRIVNEGMLIKGVIAGLGLMLWVSLLLYIVAPQRALALMEGGNILRLAAPFGSPNSLGRVAALVILLCGVGLKTQVLRWRTPLLWLMGFAAVACLYLSQSRSATAALVCALTLIILADRPLRLLFVAALGVCAVLVFIVGDFRTSDFALLFSRTGRITEVTTLTGRTDIWGFVWGEIQKSPIIGYGYGSTKFLLPLLYRTFWGWTTTHAHNMWLQIWFTAGAIGVLLLLATLISQFRYWTQTKDAGSLALLAFLFVIGLAEAGHLDGAPSVLTALWAVWIAGRRQGSPVNEPKNDVRVSSASIDPAYRHTRSNARALGSYNTDLRKNLAKSVSNQ